MDFYADDIQRLGEMGPRKPSRSRLSKRAAFHIANFSGWMGLMLANGYIARFFELSDARRVIWAVSFFGSGALIYLVVRYVYIRKDYRSQPLGSLTLVVMLTSLAAAAA